MAAPRPHPPTARPWIGRRARRLAAGPADRPRRARQVRRARPARLARGGRPGRLRRTAVRRARVAGRDLRRRGRALSRLRQEDHPAVPVVHRRERLRAAVCPDARSAGRLDVLVLTERTNHGPIPTTDKDAERLHLVAAQACRLRRDLLCRRRHVARQQRARRQLRDEQPPVVGQSRRRARVHKGSPIKST
ncbi:MAG: hypothetical protein F4103_00485 [Boseongicola sp. SB0673_bin_14]|nr:hypothetical protein [Boseongicola sp. SB0673_bin_14]